MGKVEQFGRMGRGGERVLYAGVKRGRAIYKKLSFKMATAFLSHCVLEERDGKRNSWKMEVF